MGDHPVGAFRRFTGNLDPRAQEFVPLNTNFHSQTQILIPTQSQLYFPFTPPPEIMPPPPPPPPTTATYFQNYGQVINIPPPFYNNYPYGSPNLQFAPPPPPPSPPELPSQSSTPSRALLLSSVPFDVSESTVRRDLEVFGDVRGVQMERVVEGIVTVHFYDLRDSEAALREINEQHVRRQARPFYLPPHVPSSPGLVSGQPVFARFVVPATGAVPGGCNQGTLVIFNLDPAVSSSTLRQLFEPYGAVKELRETPFKKHQRFVEFFDIRDASKALQEMNGKEINKKPILIEFSRPGGYKNKFFFRRVIQTPPPPPQPPRQWFSGLPKKNHNYSRNNGNPNFGVESFMSTLSINNIGGNREEIATNRMEVNAGERSQRKSRGNGKWWRNKNMKTDNARFLISEEFMEDSSCKDPRTTLMIKNIPNKYSQKLLLNMLDNHCINCNEQIGTLEGDESQPLSSYDFVYLPIDFGNKCNVGYGFVNMTSPQAAWRFYKAFHLQHWEVFNSRKICHVTYARLQGLEALKEHFKSTKFPYETENYLPVFFSPPRDGVHLTDPVPIAITKASTEGEEDHDQTEGPDPSSSTSSQQAEHDEMLPPPSSSGEGGESSTNDSDNNNREP